MPDRRPNILLLFTDQQRWDTIGALGSPVLRTPNLDRLVAEGTSFTDAFSPSPVCVPARACLHYGQYPWGTGCSGNGDPMPLDGRPSFMDLLASSGYRTHAIGKCHFTPDPQALRGFQSREAQEEIVERVEDDDYLTFLREHGKGFEHVRDPHGARSEMVYMPQVSQLPQRLHPTQWVGDRSMAFIDTQPSGRPWLLFSSFIHPHPPYAPPPAWEKLYRLRDIAPPHCPEGYEDLVPFVPRSRLAHYYHDDPRHPTLWRIIRAFYFACVSFVDHQVGRILEALERSGQLDRTLVLFASDHGDLLGDYGLMGKQCMLDPSVRVPLLARLPGTFGAGERCARACSLVDVGPTILSAAGVRTPPQWDGVDLAQLARLSPTPRDGAQGVCPATPDVREIVFSQILRGPLASYMAVSSAHKYAYSAPDNREYFFDRITDPRETRNLAPAARGTEPFEHLKRALLARLRDAGATDGVDGDDWRIYPAPPLPDPEAHRNVRDNPWADYSVCD